MTDSVKVVLVDINKKMVEAWREVFEDHPEVEIVQGSMLDQKTTAWVSPTNTYGTMDGGLDGVIKTHIGSVIEKRLKDELTRLYQGKLPLGVATCVETGRDQPRYLISTPTMHSSSEDVSDSLNTALACAAAFQAVKLQNKKSPGSIASVALPGLGANTGRVPVDICADLMWTGYRLFREEDIADFAALRKALESELGDLTPMSKKTAAAKKAPPPKPMAPPPKPAQSAPTPKAADEDFDDFD